MHYKGLTSEAQAFKAFSKGNRMGYTLGSHQGSYRTTISCLCYASSADKSAFFYAAWYGAVHLVFPIAMLQSV